MQAKQSSELLKIGIAVGDLGLIFAAFLLSLTLRFGDIERSLDFIWLFYLSAPLIIFLMWRNGVLTGFRYQRLRDILKLTLYAFAVAGVVCSTVLYLSKTADYSRLLFGTYFALAALFVLLEKTIIKKLVDRHLRNGGMNIRIAMVGFGEKFDEILEELYSRPQLGLAPVLVINPLLTDAESIVKAIRSAVIDEVYISYPRGDIYTVHVDDLLNRLETFGLPVRVALNFDELQNYYSQQVCAVGSKTGIMLAPYNLDPDQLLLKRMMDLAGGSIGLLITALLYPIMAILIKLDSPGPVFFSHSRAGKGGRSFTIYKFRSMYAGAEQKKLDLQGSNIHDGPIFKVEDDPRITRVGRVIRKFSLDEFPQFWNVLKGEMSLVGTRPPTLDEVAEYEDHHFRRISIKPGLTGLWQVSGRNKITDFDEVVALDVRYIREWNLWFDVKIILRTLMIVLFPRGSSGGI
jgi:exopolysaccharide biosynthesis polyprenyl glycosylphosphotransferase